MQVQPILNGLRASLESQRNLAGGDAAVDDAVAWLTEALGPALRVAALELAQQAAVEVSAQLDDRDIDVVVVDGDPHLRATDAAAPPRGEAADEDFAARITLRLPPSLKNLIEEAATTEGGSVNGWVVDALSKRASRSESRGRRVTEGFDL
jgi:HicB family